MTDSPALAKLVALVPPPKSPTAAKGDFAKVEADLGTPLPSDWKALVETYGYGSFVSFLHLWSPFFEACTMVAQAKGALDADRTLAKMSKKAVPFTLFPDPDGALPFASTDNGDVLYWLTWGAPNEWPVAVWNARSGESYDLFEGGACALLAAWLGGEHEGNFLSSREIQNNPDLEPCFDPWRERTHVTINLDGTGLTTYAERLAALIATLGPVEMRGSYGDQEEEKRQVHFVANDGAWRVTYDTVYGHNVRLDAPPAEIDDARARIAKAAAAMGLTIRT